MSLRRRIATDSSETQASESGQIMLGSAASTGTLVVVIICLTENDTPKQEEIQDAGVSRLG